MRRKMFDTLGDAEEFSMRPDIRWHTLFIFRPDGKVSVWYRVNNTSYDPQCLPNPSSPTIPTNLCTRQAVRDVPRPSSNLVG